MQPAILATAPRCGARTRSGGPCRSPAVHGNRRCRMHGGKGSGAPRGNRNAWKHGAHSARFRAVARFIRETSVVLRTAHLHLRAWEEARHMDADAARRLISLLPPLRSAVPPRRAPDTEKSKKGADNPMHPESGAPGTPPAPHPASPTPCMTKGRSREAPPHHSPESAGSAVPALAVAVGAELLRQPVEALV